MKPDPVNPDWLDEIQTGRVSPERIDQLKEAAKESPRLAEELALNALLGRLPDIPVPTNLAARVVNEIERSQKAPPESRDKWVRWWAHFGVLRPAAITAVAALCLAGWWQFRLHERRVLADSVTEVSRTAAVPGVEVLQDFDAIQLLRTTSRPDDLELIAALATP